MRQKPLNIAHRGARAHAPENTLAAARLAFDVKADMWELDTGFTRDGHLIVIHDDSLARTTDVRSRPEFADREPWHIYDFTLEEIRSLDAGSWFVRDDPFHMLETGEVPLEMARAYVEEKVPTLEEALSLTKELGWQVNVEIKDHAGRIGHSEITGAVLDLIGGLGMTDRVLLSSFQHSYLREAARLMPGLRLGALVENLRPENSLELCREIGAGFYHPEFALLREDEAANLLRSGVGINPWTINSDEAMRRCVEAGFSGIITDFPARLHALLGA